MGRSVKEMLELYGSDTETPKTYELQSEGAEFSINCGLEIRFNREIRMVNFPMPPLVSSVPCWSARELPSVYLVALFSKLARVRRFVSSWPPELHRNS